MGTRADFYIGVENMKYLGSIAWDGYPEGIDNDILSATDENVYLERVMEFLKDRDDASLPERDGWPWPWNDSNTTDYAYAFHDGGVWYVNFGGNWVLARDPKKKLDLPVSFPNMEDIKNVTFGRGSGIVILGGGEHKDLR